MPIPEPCPTIWLRLAIAFTLGCGIGWCTSELRHWLIREVNRDS